MKKIVLGLIIAIIVGIAVVIFGLQYKTEQFVNKLITDAKPFADISYKEIDTSLNGTATVHGVSIFIPFLDDTIYIKSVQFLAADMMSLATLDEQLQNNQIPESMHLVITGAVIAFNGNIMKMMDDPDIPPTQMEIFSTLGCGETYRIGAKELTQMGYEDLTSDVILRYQFDPIKKQIKFYLTHNLRDMTNFNLSGDINNIVDIHSLINKTSKPGKLTLDIQDDSYIERKNGYCAKLTKRDIKAYIDDHTQKVNQYLLSFGVRPEEGLLNAYRTILESPGTITFKADLSKISGISDFMTFTPNDFIQFMHLQLFVNNKRIHEISIDIDKEKLIETATGGSEDLVTPDEIERKQALIIKKYRPVTVSQLSQFDGYRVKIDTDNGKHYKGTLKINNSVTYEIISRLRSGNISYHIPVSKIKKAAVFH
jgi:hypothetical protein